MDMRDPHYRDCVRDVVALMEQALTLHEAKPGTSEHQQAGECMKVLLDNADTVVCLRAAVSMLASSCQTICQARASMHNTSVEHELAEVFGMFREMLA